MPPDLCSSQIVPLLRCGSLKTIYPDQGEVITVLAIDAFNFCIMLVPAAGEHLHPEKTPFKLPNLRTNIIINQQTNHCTAPCFHKNLDICLLCSLVYNIITV